MYEYGCFISKHGWVCCSTGILSQSLKQRTDVGCCHAALPCVAWGTSLYSWAKRHFLLDKPFSLARFLLPYGSKQFLRRYLTLQIIPQTLPKKVRGSTGLVFVSLFPGFLRCPKSSRLDPPRWSLPSTFLGIRRTAVNLGFSSLYNGELYILHIYINNMYIYIIQKTNWGLVA